MEKKQTKRQAGTPTQIPCMRAAHDARWHLDDLLAACGIAESVRVGAERTMQIGDTRLTRAIEDLVRLREQRGAITASGLSDFLWDYQDALWEAIKAMSCMSDLLTATQQVLPAVRKDAARSA